MNSSNDLSAEEYWRSASARNDLIALGEGDLAFIRARTDADEDLGDDYPYLIFSASGELLAGVSSFDQGLGYVLQSGLTPMAVN